MNKVERLKARLKNVRESGQRIATNLLHAGEVLVTGSAAAYAEGRLSDETGEWGYKSVPYVYMGSAVMFLTGLFAGPRYSADFFMAGTGLAGGHLFRTMYETGTESKNNGTQGRKQLRSKVGMGLNQGMRQGMPVGTPMGQPVAQAPRQWGTALDGLGRV